VGTLLVYRLLVVHHVLRAGVHAGGRQVSLLRVELHVLCVTVFGCVVVELRLGHRRRSVRGVFHYVDIAVCCVVLAGVFQVGHCKGPLTF